MALSKITFSGDGVTDTFNVVFALGYIEENDVRAYVVGEVDGLGDQVYRPITFLSDTNMRIGGDIPSTSGKDIVFERTVEKETLLVDYVNSDIMSEENLNTSQKQMLMSIHEALDGRLGAQAEDRDMGGFRITNLGVPTGNSDAVTKQYVDQTIPTNVSEAKTARDEAVAARNAAVIARDSALGYASTAQGHSNSAAQHAVDASTAAGVAEGFKDDAEDAADTSVLASQDAEDARDAAVLAQGAAESARDIASGHASAASGSAGTASGAAIAAADARDDAIIAKEAAELAQSNAEDARDDAQDILDSLGGLEVTPEQFGAVGDGVADDTQAFEDAMASLGTSGGVIRLGAGKRYLVDTITVPTNVQFQGPYVAPWRPGGTLTEDYDTQAAWLVNGTIVVNSNNSFRGILFLNAANASYPVDDETYFSGTCIAYHNATAGSAAGLHVENCTIIGFNTGLYVHGMDRPRFQNLSMDCVNCIDISNCWDIPYVENVHCWPFGTISTDNPSAAGQFMVRSGTALYIHNNVDWAKVFNFFSYGYLVGVTVDDANGATLMGVSCDNIYHLGSPGHTGSTGIIVAGTSVSTRLIGCQVAAAHSSGVYIQLDTSDQEVQIDNLNVWGGSTHGILIEGPGYVDISQYVCRDTQYGMSIANDQVYVTLSNSMLVPITGYINLTVVTDRIHIDNNNRFVGLALSVPVVTGTGSLNIPSIAVGSQLQIPKHGQVFYITGNGTINSVLGVWVGRNISLLFGGNITLTHSTSPNGVAIPGGGNITGTPGKIVNLAGVGDRWMLTANM